MILWTRREQAIHLLVPFLRHRERATFYSLIRITKLQHLPWPFGPVFYVHPPYPFSQSVGVGVSAITTIILIGKMCFSLLLLLWNPFSSITWCQHTEIEIELSHSVWTEELFQLIGRRRINSDKDDHKLIMSLSPSLSLFPVLLTLGARHLCE